MHSSAISKVLADNPKHLTSSDFLVNLAVSLNVQSIPLAIFLLILIIISIIVFIVVVILSMRHCLRKRFISIKKKKAVKSVYLDEVHTESLRKHRTLEYALYYMLKREVMKVTVVQVSNLDTGRGEGKTCDPYVIVTPVVNDKGSLRQSGGSQKTKVKNRSTNPTWNVSFYFHVSEDDLSEFAIKFEVFDYDSIGQDISLGSLVVNFKELRITEYTENVLEKTELLQTGSPQIVGLGDVCVGLSYSTSKQQLYVTIFEGRQLNLDSGQSKWRGIVFRVDAKVNKQTVESHTTRQNKDLVNPYFNDHMTFNIKLKHLQDAQLVFTLRSISGILRLQTKIGCFELGNVSRFTTGVKHWNEMLRGYSRMHVMWHIIDQRVK